MEIEANIQCQPIKSITTGKFLIKAYLKKREDGHFGSCFSKVINQFLETLELAGLSGWNGSESIAQARSLLQENDDRTSLVVDLGIEEPVFW